MNFSLHFFTTFPLQLLELLSCQVLGPLGNDQEGRDLVDVVLDEGPEAFDVILGLGRIGKAVARRAEVFGLNIGYYDIKPMGDLAYRSYASLHDLAGASDILMVVSGQLCSMRSAHSTARTACSALEASSPSVSESPSPMRYASIWISGVLPDDS